MQQQLKSSDTSVVYTYYINGVTSHVDFGILPEERIAEGIQLDVKGQKK